MAPPRRSSTRQTSATPLKPVSPAKRSTGGTNNLPESTSASRRSIRGSSQRPDQTNGATTYSNLPEVQTQQSYAYGSTKTPLLPEQLIARGKMSLTQMAEMIDQGKRQAEQRIDDHAAERESNLASQLQADARSARARRRASQEDSKSPPREGSYESLDTEVRKTQRTAAWASSLDSENLQNIEEEDSAAEDDETRRGTDPSSFPSGIFDTTYNYERGNRGPRLPSAGATAMQNFFGEIRKKASRFLNETAHVSGTAVSAVRNISKDGARLLWQSLPYIGFVVGAILISGLGLFCLSWVFCQTYSRTLCDPSSTSIVQMTLQSYCGSCKTFSLPEILTPEQQADPSFLTKALNELRRQLHEAEARITSRLDTKHNLHGASLDELRERQRDIEIQIYKLENKNPSAGGQGSLLHKVNYFSPGAGAIIDPFYTSPVLQRKFNLVQRLYLRLTGTTKYISRPPAAGIEAWEDLGDCFCSPGADGNVRLGVSMGHMIFPTEVVIEHYPASGSPNPQTAPQEVEIWANFRHLSATQYADLGIWDLKGTNPIGPTMGKIGTVRYDGRPGVNHIQIFKLDVNQGALLHSTDEVVIKVNSNHGAPHTCIYRVRLHGVPVTPHPLVASADADN